MIPYSRPIYSSSFSHELPCTFAYSSKITLISSTFKLYVFTISAPESGVVSLEELTELELNESELDPLKLDELELPEEDEMCPILKLFDA